MAKSSKKVSNNYLVSALVSIVIGVLFCIYKGSILSWLMTALGVVLIVYGVMDILNYKKVNGIVEIVIGVAIIVSGWTITAFVLIVVGVLLILWGIMNVKYINSKNLFTTLKVIFSIVLGVLLVAQKFVVVDWFFIVIGVVAIINGITILLGNK